MMKLVVTLPSSIVGGKIAPMIQKLNQVLSETYTKKVNERQTVIHEYSKYCCKLEEVVANLKGNEGRKTER